MAACGCIGPQNGEPVCPCRMRSVKIKDGRYVEVNDLGPVQRAWEHHVNPENMPKTDPELLRRLLEMKSRNQDEPRRT